MAVPSELVEALGNAKVSFVNVTRITKDGALKPLLVNKASITMLEYSSNDDDDTDVDETTDD